MKQLFPLMGKIFLFCFIAFGIVTLPVTLIVSGIVLGEFIRRENVFILQYGWVVFVVLPVVAGILFGLPMALVLGILQYHHVRKIIKSGPINLSVKQSREMILPSDRIVEKCRAAIVESGAGILEKNSNRDAIAARSPSSWKSWSEDIRVEIADIGAGRSKIIVSSRPSVKTTLVDYGKNYENVERLCNLLKNP